MPPVWLLTLAAGVRVVLPMAALALAGSSSLLVTEPGPDRYLSLAQWLGHTGRFTHDGIAPELFRLPGYPVLLVPGVWLGWPMTYGLALNAVAGALTVALVWRGALLLGASRASALTAAVIVAVDPVLVIWASRLMAESVFAALVAAAAVVLIGIASRSENQTVRRRRWREAAILGVLLASMVYVRPVALAVPPILLIGGMLRRAAGDRALLHVLGRAVVVCALLLLPWIIRNGVVAGYWGLTTLPARGAYLAYGAAVEARSAGRPFLDERALRLVEETRAVQQQGVAAYGRLLGDGLASAMRQPLQMWRIYAGGLVRTIADPGGIEYVRLFGRYPLRAGLLNRVVRDGFVTTAVALTRERPGTMAVMFAAGVPLLALLVLATAGFRALARRQAGAAVLTGCLVGGLLVPAGGPHGNARFRLPATPVLGLWAAVALEARRQRQRKSVTERKSEDPANTQAPA